METPIDSSGSGTTWGQSYQLPGEAYLAVNSSFEDALPGERRRACAAADERTISCTETVIGGRMVRVAEVDYSGKGADLARQVDVFPVDGSSGPYVSVDAGVMGPDASLDALPSVDELTAIAVDPRLAPTQERPWRPTP